MTLKVAVAPKVELCAVGCTVIVGEPGAALVVTSDLVDSDESR